MSSYNFDDMENAVRSISYKPNGEALNMLKTELNNFFSDARCREVIYTNNTDKMFFGMSVIPVIPSDYLVNTINGKFKKFGVYILEIDSRLLQLNLSPSELTAIVLHEVGHIVNDVQVSKDISEVINVVMAEEGIRIDKRELMKREDYVNVGVQRAIRKFASFFHKNEGEYIADHFVVDCGYGKYLESAYDKIVTNRDSVSSSSNKYKISTLLLNLSTYNDLDHRRKVIMDELKTQETMEGSTLMKRIFNRGWKNISKAKAPIIQVYTEGFLSTIKYSDIKRFDKELYEYNIRINNIEDEVEAIDVLRDLNYRIGLMEEYLDTGNEDKRTVSLLKKYEFLREELMKKPKYEDKMYGLFVKHPEIKSRYSSRI